ncbi:MAG: hypothetical protein ACXWE9_10290 [Methylobacter sp.]
MILFTPSTTRGSIFMGVKASSEQIQNCAAVTVKAKSKKKNFNPKLSMPTFKGSALLLGP